MMLIQTTQAILDYEGVPMVNGDKPFTVRDAIFLVLNTYAGQYVPSTQEKADAFRLTMLVNADATAEVTIEDAALIKAASGRSTASPLVHGRLCELLENAAQLAPNADTNGAGTPVELATVD